MAVTVFILVVAGCAGLAVGSFLDVIAYRLPRGLSLSRPRSYCPACTTTLRWFDNVPVVSWLALRGRCRTCGGTIPGRILVVESGTALAFVGIALAMGRSWAIPGLCLMAATVLACGAAATDGSPMPASATLIGTGFGVVALLAAAAGTGQWGHLIRTALGVGAGGLASVSVSIAAARHHRKATDPGRTDPGNAWWAVAEALDVLLPTGALLGWLGAEPAAGGAGAALLATIGSTAVGWHLRRSRKAEQSVRTEPSLGTGDLRRSVRIATVVVALAAMAGALATAAALRVTAEPTTATTTATSWPTRRESCLQRGGSSRGESAVPSLDQATTFEGNLQVVWIGSRRHGLTQVDDLALQ